MWTAGGSVTRIVSVEGVHSCTRSATISHRSRHEIVTMLRVVALAAAGAARITT
jgi:hypothetical protein